jgi:NAD(P)H-dependent flavin oxidoreductase YrpB (nitropropane dioxygenase family)
MGVGVSNFELSGEVARNGGVGTLSSAALCMLPQYKHLLDEAIQEAKKHHQPLPLELRQEIFRQVNLDCIKLEVQKAKKLADGK